MLDLTKLTYRVMVMDENNNQYNIKDYIQNLGWEENEGELAVRSSFTVRNDRTAKGKLSSLIKPGCMIGIFASDGKSVDQEVARGYVTEWNPQLKNNSDSLQCTSYDILYTLQKSQDNRFYASGTGTQSIVTGLLEEYGVPVQGYNGPNVAHGKLKYNNAYISDMIMDVLDDAGKRSNGTYFLRSSKGYAEVVERGRNTETYVFETENTQSVSTHMSLSNLVTRVRVIGRENKEGNFSVEATLNGMTKYGIRQRIYTRGTDETLEDAKAAAQQILDENGTVQEEITLEAPDVPFIRKGDVVCVKVGVSCGLYYVKGIQHNCDSYSMTMKLRMAKPLTITAEDTAETKKEYHEGDIVEFHGGTHYTSSYCDAKGYPARAGQARITKKNGAGKAHPWHLVHVDQSSNVYGWVDEGTFS